MGLPLALFLGVGLSFSTPAVPRSPETLETELAAVRKRAAKTRPGTSAARQLARDLGGIGQGYLELGDSGRAVQLLEEAFGWDEDNGLVLAELTLAYIREEDYSFARFYLELAEQRASEAPPEAYATLGEIYYALNRVEDAVLAWEQFERLQGNDPAVLKRLARARQELSLSHGQRQLDWQEFSVYSDAAIPPELAEAVAERLSRSYREETGLFATRLDGQQVVVLYAGRAYFSLVSVPDWVGGVFDGKIRISMDPDSGITPALEGVLSHELAHAMIRKASGDRAPGWLHEGLAQWAEGKRLQPREFKEIFAGGRKPASLPEMEGNLARRSDRAAARANYAQALGMVEYLFQKRGEGAVTCLLQALAEGLPLEDALRRETGMTGTELVAGWKAWAGI